MRGSVKQGLPVGERDEEWMHRNVIWVQLLSLLEHHTRRVKYMPVPRVF
jgi:hypothetical protein